MFDPTNLEHFFSFERSVHLEVNIKTNTPATWFAEL
jgi:hypothetical protein